MVYKQIEKKNIEFSEIAKITGMLIDLEILELDEVIEMLEDEDVLAERIKEALEVIYESESGN